MPRPTDNFFPYPEKDFFDDGIPGSVISASGFNSYKLCGKSYEYTYVLGLRGKAGVPALKGKTLHKGAEIILRRLIETKKLMSLEEAQQLTGDYWEKNIKEVDSWLDNDGNALKPGVIKDKVRNALRVYYLKAVPMFNPIAVEKPFAAKVGTVPVRGVIDLIDSGTGEYSLGDDPEQPPPTIKIVADLKTTARKWPAQKIKFDTQFTFYSIVENVEDLRVDFLLDQKSGTAYIGERTTRTNREKNICIEDLEEAVYNIKKGVFPRCDPTTWKCTPKFCSNYERCRGID